MKVDLWWGFVLCMVAAFGGVWLGKAAVSHWSAERALEPDQFYVVIELPQLDTSQPLPIVTNGAIELPTR
jgi:hypothetical protein